MSNTVIWVKPWSPEHHEVGTEGHAGRCGWHGINEGTPCPEEPFASVKFQYADYAPVHSACKRALHDVSRRYGFPIPQD